MKRETKFFLFTTLSLLSVGCVLAFYSMYQLSIWVSLPGVISFFALLYFLEKERCERINAEVKRQMAEEEAEYWSKYGKDKYDEAYQDYLDEREPADYS